MSPLRKELEQGKRALLAFFIDGRYSASFPKAAWGHPLGGAGVRRLNPRILPLAAHRIRGFRQSGARASLGGEWEVGTRGDIEFRERALEAMEAIDNPAIAEEVIRRLGLDGSMEPADLLDNLTVEEIEDTQFVQLSYRDANPLRAQRIANAVAKVASEEVGQEAFVYGLRIHVLEEAALPNTPVSPKPLRNAALALIFGLMVGPVLAIWMDERA